MGSCAPSSSNILLLLVTELGVECGGGSWGLVEVAVAAAAAAIGADAEATDGPIADETCVRGVNWLDADGATSTGGGGGTNWWGCPNPPEATACEITTCCCGCNGDADEDGGEMVRFGLLLMVGGGVTLLPAYVNGIDWECCMGCGCEIFDGTFVVDDAWANDTSCCCPCPFNTPNRCRYDLIKLDLNLVYFLVYAKNTMGDFI